MRGADLFRVARNTTMQILNDNESLVLVLKVNTDSLRNKGICKSDRLNIFISGNSITLEVWREGDQFPITL